jgi:hypothetical protein
MVKHLHTFPFAGNEKSTIIFLYNKIFNLDNLVLCYLIVNLALSAFQIENALKRKLFEFSLLEIFFQLQQYQKTFRFANV